LNQHGVQPKPLLLAYVKHATDVARYLDLFPEQQSVLKKKTSAYGSPWTKEDVRELKTHSKARTPLPEIAKKIKRTERALRRKAGILGIGLGHNR
jgi:hypothetical protein